MSKELVRACWAITVSAEGPTRCLEPDPTHRGPHWRNVELITCDCRFFCYGHDA